MIDVKVDLRAQLYGARDQGGRPTCIVFAISDLNMFCNKLNTHQSTEYLSYFAAQNTPSWAPGDGFTDGAVRAALNNNGQPSEALYPYIKDKQEQPLIPPPVGLSPINFLNTLDASVSERNITADLHNSKITLLVTSLTQTFYSPVNAVVDDSDYAVPGLHAILVVGYGFHKQNKAPYFLIRNSWGGLWGDNGHAWVSSQYINKHGKFIIKE